jgi:ribosomal protein L4
MSDSADPNYEIKIEKAISEKYGEETVQHPSSNWDEEKERDYLEQLKELASKVKRLTEKTEKMEVQGVLISKKLLNRDSNRVCSVCDVYSFDRRDDVFMSKYDCCNRCHVQWIEGREKRWTDGWRPKKENK